MAFSVTNTFVAGTKAKASEVNTNFTDVEGAVNNRSAQFGEVRMFALSMTGAVTKASLQGKGWAICDGSTPASQGISSPTITTTPDLQDKFISMSNDETSGTTGGSATHNHKWLDDAGGSNSLTSSTTNGAHTFQSNGSSTLDFNTPAVTNNSWTQNTTDLPPFYEMAFFMYVKEV